MGKETIKAYMDVNKIFLNASIGMFFGALIGFAMGSIGIVWFISLELMATIFFAVSLVKFISLAKQYEAEESK